MRSRAQGVGWLRIWRLSSANWHYKVSKRVIVFSQYAWVSVVYGVLKRNRLRIRLPQNTSEVSRNIHRETCDTIWTWSRDTLVWSIPQLADVGLWDDIWSSSTALWWRSLPYSHACHSYIHIFPASKETEIGREKEGKKKNIFKLK